MVSKGNPTPPRGTTTLQWKRIRDQLAVLPVSAAVATAVARTRDARQLDAQMQQVAGIALAVRAMLKELS